MDQPTPVEASVFRPTIAGEVLKVFAADPKNQDLAATYLKLQAKAKQLRAEMDALYKPIFAQFEFFDKQGYPITYEQNRLYRCNDEKTVEEYYEAIDRAVVGYNLPKNYCPALTASHAVVEHEWEILKVMSPVLGCDVSAAWGETRTGVLQAFMKIIGNS